MRSDGPSESGWVGVSERAWLFAVAVRTAALPARRRRERSTCAQQRGEERSACQRLQTSSARALGQGVRRRSGGVREFRMQPLLLLKVRLECSGMTNRAAVRYVAMQSSSIDDRVRKRELDARRGIQESLWKLPSRSISCETYPLNAQPSELADSRRTFVLSAAGGGRRRASRQAGSGARCGCPHHNPQMYCPVRRRGCLLDPCCRISGTTCACYETFETSLLLTPPSKRTPRGTAPLTRLAGGHADRMVKVHSAAG